MKNAIILCCLLIALVVNSCQPAGGSDLQAQKDLIFQANEELLNLGNFDYADEVFTDNYRDTGPEAIKKMAKDLRGIFPDLQVKIDPIIAEGDMTGWRRIHTGTHQGTIMGFPPTGKKITWESVILSRYENGKIVEEWGQSDLLEVLQNASEPPNDPEQVIAVVQSAMDALNDKNAEAYLAHSHPAHTRFLPTGPTLFTQEMTVDEMTDDFENGLEFDMQLEEPRVAFHGNTAIVTGYQTGTNRFPNGQVVDGRRKYTSVMAWEAGKWQTVHLHISKVSQ
ncbi:ester cyclase [Flavilitoribacter nigricans]|uniref:DUF4440 domain-containing protein n=1 Tax=Flavilitoribacter nigricans (strain ATCC 23147 / DSM 23189 / NBRC 102662 / NCIMB 1420 / SS-2) TaxID=1122177 RepID=A0A2D0NAV0_FLAN2|nr:ester cyclase [Flavilitoribacter nigricans]PHN05516.1 hypothetical protein CRP01_16095 [Flavilitoribacter nigricans DSM 23189 = NBRC 102662]